METQQISLKWECIDLPVCPAETRIGIQRNREVIADQLLAQGSLSFSFEVILKAEHTDFAGPFVHGKRGERFVYLVWGTRHESGFQMSGRSKIGLSKSLPWELVKKCQAVDNIIHATIRLSNAKGTPALGTLKEGMVDWQCSAVVKE